MYSSILREHEWRSKSTMDTSYSYNWFEIAMGMYTHFSTQLSTCTVLRYVVSTVLAVFSQLYERFGQR